MVPIPENEAERLAVLRGLDVLGNESEPHYDAICRTAAALFGVPIALVSFIDEDYQWYKGRCGVSIDGTTRKDALCAYTILSDEVLVCEDTVLDPRFVDNALVTGEPFVRFYAGAPLIAIQGVQVGALCLIDRTPRRFSEAQRLQLRDLAQIVSANLRVSEINALQRREVATQHAAILGQLAEGVIVTDDLGRIAFVNKAAEQLHGVARLDVEPDDYSATYRLYTEDGLTYAPRELPLARAVRGETVNDARWRVHRPDGTEVLAIGTAKPLRGLDGLQIGSVLTMRDDTAREAAERSLRELNATLAEKVAERTREAEALRAHAEAASQAKSEFLAVMSHEIRTPLNAVIGFADLMVRSGRLDAALQRQAELICMSGSALLTVVNDILDFSKVEAGALELVREPFSLRSLVNNCIAIVRSQAVAKGLDVHAVLDTDLPSSLLGDQARLRQILLNLLNNAVKFTHLGSVVLTVRHEGTSPAGECLRLSVSDTGIGIPLQKQPRLFEQFSQVDGSIQRDFGGTGLGLAICKRLVELMEGELGVVSTEGGGATLWFTVNLPRAAATGRDSNGSAAPGLRRTGHLLLVEDSAINQELACAVLEGAGHTVDVASDGSAALVALAAKAYDVVLMDVQMPGMDGMTATRLIRRLSNQSARVPVIAMTANVLPDQIRSFRDAGMDAHIGKPFNPVDLCAAVAKWLPLPTGSEEPDAHDQTFDWAAFRSVSAMLKPARLADVLKTLREDLRESFSSPFDTPQERDGIRFEAHALTSAAGMLGFTELSRVCRALDTCDEADIAAIGLEPFLRHRLRARTLAAAALQKIDLLIGHHDTAPDRDAIR